ncbi:MAG: endonuclease/exonuclease/phosphatase family protein [Proteobacteria bacterium]|nr:endonuclease/exonuclease/phosphatase family protein [Pseudomonadota bacterium]
MKVMTFNIRQGGGDRNERIIDSIASHNPDTLVLTEFRENKNSQFFRTRLSELGYLNSAVASIEKGLNTVCVASKKSFVPETFHKELNGEGHRLVVANFNEFSVVGVYFAQKQEKEILFNFLNDNALVLLNKKCLIIGDFNTGRHFLDEVGKTFHCAKEFEDLERNGFIDIWRSRHFETQEYSWFSYVGNGFRIDHAFASPDLNNMVKSVFYSHKERENGISDHSAMIIDFR